MEGGLQGSVGRMSREHEAVRACALDGFGCQGCLCIPCACSSWNLADGSPRRGRVSAYVGGGGGGLGVLVYFEGKAGGGGERLIGAWAYFPEALGGGGGANGVQFPGEEGGEAAYRLSGVLSGRGGLAYRRIGEGGGGGGGKRVSVYLAGKGGGGSGTQDAICNICIWALSANPCLFFLLANILYRFLLVF